MTCKSISFAPDILIKVSKCPGCILVVKVPARDVLWKFLFFLFLPRFDARPPFFWKIYIFLICISDSYTLDQALPTNYSIEIALGCKSSRFELTWQFWFLPWWDARSDVHNKMHWSPINSHSTTFSIIQWVCRIIPAHFARFPLCFC